MQTEGKIKIDNKKRVIRIKYRVFVPVKCHVRTLGYNLGWIPNSLACLVVVLSCSACLVFRRTEFQGHLKRLRHAVV